MLFLNVTFITIDKSQKVVEVTSGTGGIDGLSVWLVFVWWAVAWYYPIWGLCPSRLLGAALNLQLPT